MTTPELASIDGRISPTDEARVPVADDGVRRGDGVFEVIRLYGGHPYALDEHLRRLQASAEAIELAIDEPALRTEIDALLAEFGNEHGQLRLIVTRAGRRLALTEPLPPRTETIRLATVTYAPSVILNGVKSLSYAANMQATRLAQARDADEALLVAPEGIILEAPTSSFFWTSPDGRLRTTSLDAGVLESITRARIVEALDVDEGAWPVSDLASTSEAFLASTTREVQAVAAIDGRELAEVNGARTEEAMTAFGRARDAALGTKAQVEG